MDPSTSYLLNQAVSSRPAAIGGRPRVSKDQARLSKTVNISNCETKFIEDHFETFLAAIGQSNDLFNKPLVKSANKDFNLSVFLRYCASPDGLLKLLGEKSIACSRVLELEAKCNDLLSDIETYTSLGDVGRSTYSAPSAGPHSSSALTPGTPLISQSSTSSQHHISVNLHTPYPVDISIRRPNQAKLYELPALRRLLNCHESFSQLENSIGVLQQNIADDEALLNGSIMAQEEAASIEAQKLMKQKQLLRQQKQLLNLKDRFGAAIGDLLDDNEVMAAVKQHLSVIHSIEESVLCGLRAEQDVMETCQLLDEELLSTRDYQEVFHMLGECTKGIGHDVSSTPLQPLSSVQAVFKACNLRILEKYKLHQVNPDTRDNNGYIADIDQTLCLMAQLSGIHSQLDSNVDDTLVPAFGGDKCPFLHNGRNLFLGHIEDMTRLSTCTDQVLLPRLVKSEENNLLLIACEMKQENHHAFEVCLSRLTGAMKNHEAGLSSRQRVRDMKTRLNEVRKAQHADSVSSEVVASLVEEEKVLTSAITAFYEDAHAKGEVLKVPETGEFFFVEWHTISDLAALRTALGIEGEGSKKYPCPVCLATYEETKDIARQPRNFAKRDLSNSVFPLPTERLHGCTMHCIHRITERILQYIMQLIDSMSPQLVGSNRAAQAAQQNAYMAFREQFLSVLNSTGQVNLERHNKHYSFKGMNLNGGKCRFDYQFGRANKVNIVSLNGEDCPRFLDGAAELVDFVTRMSPAGQYHPHREHLLSAIRTWREACRLLELTVYTGSDKEQAVAASRAFVQVWALQLRGNVTHYMHILFDHPDWFFCRSGGEPESLAPAMFSTQAVERGHHTRKLVHRSKTMHGKPLSFVLRDGQPLHVSVAPGIFQIFLWHFRMVNYRLCALSRSEGDELVTVNVQQLEQLNRIPAEQRASKVYSEEELVAMLQYPPGTRINLVGIGEIRTAVSIQVSRATKAAVEKITRCHLTLPDGTQVNGSVQSSSKVVGKRPASQRREQVQQEAERKKAKLDRVVNKALHDYPIP